MIIFQINVQYVTIGESESNPPIAGHTNAPSAFPVASKRMEPVTRDVEFIQAFGLVKHKQNALNAVAHVGTDAAFISSFKKLSQASMPDAPDHALL
jgi:hypothetical protein